MSHTRKKDKKKSTSTELLARLGGSNTMESPKFSPNTKKISPNSTLRNSADNSKLEHPKPTPSPGGTPQEPKLKKRVSFSGIIKELESDKPKISVVAKTFEKTTQSPAFIYNFGKLETINSIKIESEQPKLQSKILKRSNSTISEQPFRVLVAEDEHINRTTYERLLQNAFPRSLTKKDLVEQGIFDADLADIVVCEHGLAALNRWRKAHHLGRPFDFVLVDYNMQNGCKDGLYAGEKIDALQSLVVNGFGVAMAIRAEENLYGLKPVPIFLISGTAENEEQAIEWNQKLIDNYLAKDGSKADIDITVAQRPKELFTGYINKKLTAQLLAEKIPELLKTKAEEAKIAEEKLFSGESLIESLSNIEGTTPKPGFN